MALDPRQDPNFEPAEFGPFRTSQYRWEIAHAVPDIPPWPETIAKRERRENRVAITKEAERLKREEQRKLDDDAAVKEATAVLDEHLGPLDHAVVDVQRMTDAPPESTIDNSLGSPLAHSVESLNTPGDPSEKSEPFDSVSAVSSNSVETDSAKSNSTTDHVETVSAAQNLSKTASDDEKKANIGALPDNSFWNRISKIWSGKE